MRWSHRTSFVLAAALIFAAEASARAQDAAVRSAFTISEEGRNASAIKSQQFWRTLAASERLAAEIQKSYER